jgi:hypothetical protein
MPYYKITIRLKQKILVVYRQYKETDIERVWSVLENKCRQKWASQLQEFTCIILGKRSNDYREYRKQLSRPTNGLHNRA